MASKENKIRGLQEFAKSIRRGEGGAAIAKLLYYSLNPTPVDVSTKNKTETSTVTKNNNKKITTTKNNNTRKGISASILNQSNLLKKKSTTKKKTLLGG